MIVISLTYNNIYKSIYIYFYFYQIYDYYAFKITVMWAEYVNNKILINLFI